ncbi:MAG: twitching motility protein PilT, partial [Deltaproteobacteria bacterium]
MALFPFGRTIHCTCGSRVGIEPRVRPAPGGREVRFAVDAMLGRLARWLRIMGCDAVYEPDIDDASLVRCALEEQRVLLTRDRALPTEWRVPRVRVLSAEAPLDQLREVARAFGLDWRARLFTRCNRCNAELVSATPAEVEGCVPPR